MAFEIIAKLKMIDNMTKPIKRAMSALKDIESATGKANTKLSAANKTMDQAAKATDRFSKATSNTGSAIQSTDRAANQMGKTLNSTSRATDQTAKASSNATGAMGRMESAGRRAASSMRGLANSGGGMGSLVTSVAGVATAYVGASQAIGAFKKAAELEQSEVTVRALFKGEDDKAAAFFTALQDRAAETMYSLKDYQSSAAALIPVSGRDLGKLDTMTKLAERLAAAVPEQGLGGASYAMREFFSGDAVSLTERFNLSRKDLNEIKDLPLEKQLQGLDKILDELGYTTKLVADQGKTSLGQWAQVTGMLEQKITNMVKGSLERIKPILERINSAISSGGLDKYFAMGSDAIVKLTDKAIAFGKWLVEIQPRVAAVFNDISKDISSLTEKFGGIGGAAKSAVDYVLNNWSTLKPVIYGVAGAIGAWTLAQAALNIALTANPIGLVIAAIGGLVGAGYAIYKNWDILKGKAIELWDRIGPLGRTIAFLASGPFGAIVAAGVTIYKNWDAIKTKAVELWDRLGPIGPALVALTGPIGAVIMGGVSLIKNWDAINEGAIGLWNGVKSAFTTGVNHVINKINVLIDAYNKVAGKIKKIDPISPIVDSTAANIVKATNPPMTAEASAGPSPNPLMRNGWEGAPKKATGIDYVPRNNYPILAHRGEKLLTAPEAGEYRSGESAGRNNVRGGGKGDVIITGNTFNVRKDSDIEAIARELSRQVWKSRSAVTY